jgi:hypothetical protein
MKLNQREKRILIGGVVVGLAIVAYNFGPRVIGHWREVRASIRVLEAKLKDMPDPKQQAALQAVVPVFKIPETEEKQKILFRDQLYDFVQKAGINSEPLSFTTVRKKIGAYRVLFIKCKAKCKLDQLLDFLASLKQDESLMGVEELRIQADTKQPPERRQDVETEMTFSTLAQDVAVKTTPKEPS